MTLGFVEKGDSCSENFRYATDIQDQQLFSIVKEMCGKDIEKECEIEKLQVEDIYSEMYTWYLFIMIFIAIGSTSTLFFITKNAIDFGIKQLRFKKSMLLTAFYSFSFLCMLNFICQSYFIIDLNTLIMQSKKDMDWEN